jgi:hypothetical protein
MDDKKRLAQEIDNTLNHKLNIADSVMILAHTPDVLQQLGLKDYPILMSQNHVRNCLHEKGKNPHWHGLDKSDLIGLIDQLQAPALVMDSLNNDYSIIAVTSTVDKDNLPIIATLRCYGEGQYELATLQSNYLTSVYGRTNFSNFLDRHVKAHTLLYADKEKVQRLEQFSQPQLLRTYSFFFGRNKIIRQSSNVGQAQNIYYHQIFQGYLHTSLVVEDATTNTKYADQFIVGIDNDNERFIVYSDTNPVGWKLFEYPFADAIHNMHYVDGENHVTLPCAHMYPYISRHVASLRDYIERTLPHYYDRNPTKLVGADTDCLPVQMDYISSISPSFFAVPEFIKKLENRYARLQESAKSIKKESTLADDLQAACKAANKQHIYTEQQSHNRKL